MFSIMCYTRSLRAKERFMCLIEIGTTDIA